VGGLIAECCRRGRPPFVIVLDDGSQTGPEDAHVSPDDLARLHEQETREALTQLGLSGERLLMMGLYDGTVPSSGRVFEAIVNAVTVVMWGVIAGSSALLAPMRTIPSMSWPIALPPRSRPAPAWAILHTLAICLLRARLGTWTFPRACRPSRPGSGPTKQPILRLVLESVACMALCSHSRGSSKSLLRSSTFDDAKAPQPA
jgi:hypothetical protein